MMNLPEMVNNFVPYKQSASRKSLTNTEKWIQGCFLKNLRDLYKKSKSYLYIYYEACKNVILHLWMSLNEDSFSPLIRRSLEKISNLLGKQTINIDFLFDEQVLVKKYYVSSESKERSLNATTSLERDWIHMFQTFKILSSLHFVCLQHQHQWIEFFSIMKNM